ncbi:MAG: hypothetical protein ACYCZ1_07030 [Candidatus Humimicrobiaceae bacterium]
MKSIACIKNKDFTFEDNLSDNEYNTLQNYFKPLNKLNYEINFINDLKACFEDLDSFIIKFISGNIPPQIFQKDLNRQVLNYLFLIRAFLDKWEKHVKKKFGKESEELTNFANLTHYEYDKNFYYRFLYNLSNFARHSGIACHEISTSLNDDNTKNLEIFIDKRKLLDDFEWKKSFYNEINLLPEDKIDIYLFLKDMFKSLEKIHSKAIEHNIVKDIDNLVKNSLFLINFLNEYKDCDGEISIIEHEENLKEIKTMHIERLPLKIAVLIIKTYLNAHKKYIKTFNFNGQYLGKIVNSFPIKKNDGFF